MYSSPLPDWSQISPTMLLLCQICRDQYILCVTHNRTHVARFGILGILYGTQPLETTVCAKFGTLKQTFNLRWANLRKFMWIGLFCRPWKVERHKIGNLATFLTSTSCDAYQRRESTQLQTFPSDDIKTTSKFQRLLGVRRSRYRKLTGQEPNGPIDRQTERQNVVTTVHWGTANDLKSSGGAFDLIVGVEKCLKAGQTETTSLTNSELLRRAAECEYSKSEPSSQSHRLHPPALCSVLPLPVVALQPYNRPTNLQCLSLRKSIQPVNNWVTTCWCGYLSEVQIVCIWSSWCHYIPKPHNLLPV